MYFRIDCWLTHILISGYTRSHQWTFAKKQQQHSFDDKYFIVECAWKEANEWATTSSKWKMNKNKTHTHTYIVRQCEHNTKRWTKREYRLYRYHVLGANKLGIYAATKWDELAKARQRQNRFPCVTVSAVNCASFFGTNRKKKHVVQLNTIAIDHQTPWTRMRQVVSNNLKNRLMTKLPNFLASHLFRKKTEKKHNVESFNR